eukprot:6473193-Amphidinium_carterae.2
MDLHGESETEHEIGKAEKIPDILVASSADEEDEKGFSTAYLSTHVVQKKVQRKLRQKLKQIEETHAECSTCHVVADDECSDCHSVGHKEEPQEQNGNHKGRGSDRRARRSTTGMVLAESFLAVTSMFVLSGMPSWVVCQPTKQISPTHREHWAEVDPDLLVLHTDGTGTEIRSWDPETARKVYARTGQLVETQQAVWEQLERG